MMAVAPSAANALPAGISIRWLTADDAPAFQALRLAGLQESPSSFGSSFEEEKDRPLQTVRERMAPQADSGILGAFADGLLVGTLGILRHTSLKQRHHMLIWGVYMAPSHRGHGMARALLAQAMAFARSVPGVLLVNLSVNATNPGALHLYQSAGFAIYGTEPAALCVDGVLHAEHLMQWPTGATGA